jgi:hypothetical protein
MIGIHFSAGWVRSALTRRWIIGMALCAAQAAAGAALAQTTSGDPVAGKALFATDCTGCHNSPASVPNGATVTGLTSALQSIGSHAGLVNTLSATDIANLSAYIANPAAGNPIPIYSPSATALAFGSASVGSPSSAMTVTVSNTGSAALTLTSITLGGSNPGDFAVAGSCTAGGSVAAASSCTISVTFTPVATGARSASLSIVHNAAGSPGTITLSGTGASAAAPAVSLSATSLAFGSQTVMMPGAAQTVTVSNSGNAPLGITTVTIGGTNASDFGVSADTCQAASLPPGGTCSVGIVFTPTVTGARSASLSIASDAAGSPAVVALGGTGLSAGSGTPAIGASPNPVSFGNQVVGAAGAPQSVTLTNTGTAALSITQLSVSGAGFSQAGTTCSASLAPQGACTVSVAFTPTGVGPASGSMTVRSNAPGGDYVVMLSGNGVAQAAGGLTLNPTSLKFPGQRLHTSSTHRVVVTNTAGAPVSLVDVKITGSQAAAFTSRGNCPIPGTLAPGARCTLAVTFTPAARGTSTATLTLDSSATGSSTVTLTGVGTQAVHRGGSGDDPGEGSGGDD